VDDLTSLEQGTAISATAGAREPTPPAGADLPLPALAQLLATAQREIDRHLNGNGTCTSCGQRWPCTSACLAEFTLGAL
jgi:hypothetical protein